MAKGRWDHVGDTEACSEDKLGPDDAGFEERARPAELQEGHQVHPLVLRLLDEGVDPAVVPLHVPQRAQVPDHARREPRHPRHRLEEDAPGEHGSLVHRVQQLLSLVTRQQVETKPHQVNRPIGCVVNNSFGFPVM